jgi:hypothetical protein
VLYGAGPLFPKLDPHHCRITLPVNHKTIQSKMIYIILEHSSRMICYLGRHTCSFVNKKKWSQFKGMYNSWAFFFFLSLYKVKRKSDCKIANGTTTFY